MNKENKEKQNSMFDLVWIIPEIIGELFLYIYIPIRLIKEITIPDDYGALSIDAILYIAIVYLLLTNIRLTGLDELNKIKWRKKEQ